MVGRRIGMLFATCVTCMIPKGQQPSSSIWKENADGRLHGILFLHTGRGLISELLITGWEDIENHSATDIHFTKGAKHKKRESSRSSEIFFFRPARLELKSNSVQVSVRVRSLPPHLPPSAPSSPLLPPPFHLPAPFQPFVDHFKSKLTWLSYFWFPCFVYVGVCACFFSHVFTRKTHFPCRTRRSSNSPSQGNFKKEDAKVEGATSKQARKIQPTPHVGRFVCRHHVAPRGQLYVGQESWVPVPLKHIDVNRQT